MKIKFWCALLFCTVFLSSCGGSGSTEGDVAGSDSSEDGSSMGDDIANEGDESASEDDEPTDGDVNSETDDSSNSDGSSDADGSEDVTPDEEDGSEVDSPTETDGDVPGTIAAGGRTIETLLADGMPAPGFPDEQIAFNSDEFVFSKSGQIAIRATVTGEPVIFVGDSSGFRPLIRRGDAMAGVANTVRFGDASELQWSSDDRLGFEVTLIGTETRTGYAIAEGDSVEVVVVPGISQVTDAQGALRTVTEVISSTTGLTSAASSISSAGVALQLRADGRLLAILPRDGELQFITRLYASAESELEERLDNGCPFSISAFTNKTIRYFDDGSLMFEASEGTERGDLEQCDGGTTLVRHANGVFSTVIGSDDPIPGPISEEFRAITLRNDIPTERIFVTSGVRSDFAIWDVGFPSEVDLIALDGELVQLATRSGAIDLGSVSTLDAFEGRVAMVVEASNSIALLAGNRGEGQPHTSFEEPGFNSLQVIVSGDGPIPDGFSSTGFWSQLRRPTIVSADTLYFTGRISDAISGSVIDESMWESDFDGVLNLILSVGDEVVIGDDVIEPIRLGSRSSAGIDLMQNVVTTPDGGLILMVNTNGNFANNILSNRDVLIHLPR